jgi:hypothetical protein
VSRQTSQSQIRFNSVLSVIEQSRFLGGEVLIDRGSAPDAAVQSGSDHRVLEFERRDPEGLALAALQVFVDQVLPVPKLSFAAGLWLVSCLPGTNGKAGWQPSMFQEPRRCGWRNTELSV